MKAYLFSTCLSYKHEINACIDLMDNAFDVACGTNLSGALPESFCFEEFFKAMDMLLESEQFEVLLKTLCFIYTHAGRFYGPHRLRLLQDILIHKFFFKLFLHWYPAVRRQYHHILVYKLRRTWKRVGEPFSPIESPVTKDKIRKPWLKRVSSKFAKKISEDTSSYSTAPSSPLANEEKIDFANAKEILSRKESLKPEPFKVPPLNSCEVIRFRATSDDLFEDE